MLLISQATVRCGSSSTGDRKRADGSWRVSLTLAMQQASCMDGSLSVEMLPLPRTASSSSSAAPSEDEGAAARPQPQLPAVKAPTEWSPERGFDWQGMADMVGFLEGGGGGSGGGSGGAEVWSIVLRLTVPAAPAEVLLKKPVWPGGDGSV